MKKLLFAFVFLTAGTAYADCQSNLGINFPANQKNSLCTNFGSAIDQNLIPKTDNTIDLGSASKQFENAYIGTDVVFGATANTKFPAASVITPSTSFPTPSAGNTLSARRTILAAGAPTAAFVALPAITANVGKTYEVYNQGSNPLAIVPSTGAINVDAALTPFSCTTLKVCQCSGLTTGVWGCSQQ